MAARQHTSTIPIVMDSVSDPVGLGPIDTLARPAANVTGTSSGSNDGTFGIKAVELLKAALPGLARLAILRDTSNPTPNTSAALQTAQSTGVQVLDLDVRNRLPAMYQYSPVVTQWGGLMSFGTNPSAIYRPSAGYVDKILRGISPTDLPVENPLECEFVVNTRTAQTLGITIPPDVEVQVTQWVE